MAKTTSNASRTPASRVRKTGKKASATAPTGAVRTKTTVAKTTATKKNTSRQASRGTTRANDGAASRFTAAEQTSLRHTLVERLGTMRSEHERVMAELHDLQADRTMESSGDDQADTGTQTFEREQELALAHGILERIHQVEHALSRLDSGTYGQCERCGNPIPKARLEAFPAVTLCVACKQLEERR